MDGNGMEGTLSVQEFFWTVWRCTWYYANQSCFVTAGKFQGCGSAGGRELLLVTCT